MIAHFRSFPLLIVAFGLMSSCNASGTPDNNGQKPAVSLKASYRYDFPTYDMELLEREDGKVLRLDSKGGWSFEGGNVGRQDLSRIYASLAEDLSDTLVISADAAAPYAAVVDALSASSVHGRLELEILGRFRIADRQSENPTIQVREFVGAIGQYELPLVVDSVRTEDQCTVLIFGEAFSGDELYYRSFKRLDEIIQGAGGVENVIARRKVFDSLVARIQSSSKTEWRCVAGAAFAVKRAGWPAVQFEVVED